MLHTAITFRDVNRFEWFDRRNDALRRASALRKQGFSVFCAGKRSRNSFDYRDIRIAAIVHNDLSPNLSWVVAWHD